MTNYTTHAVGTSPRNLVVCLDGTTNEPETGFTNVARMFDVAKKGPDQLVYYDPGVGTLGAKAAITPWGKGLTRVAGMVAGYGIHDNISEAYTWLINQYRAGDRIFIFGFSRGAYTARALTGMLRVVGMLRNDADNLVPYAVKLCAKGGKTLGRGRRLDANATRALEQFQAASRDFRGRISNPEFPHSFDGNRKQVHFLGVWDTVEFAGWLNLSGRIEAARWPFTASLPNVATARHALAIDERRRPFAESRFKAGSVAASQGRLQEVWFAGVHGDIGGQSREDHRLPDVAFSWMVKQAVEEGLLVTRNRYRSLVGVNIEDDLPAERALEVIHPNKGWWRLAGGWRSRQILDDDTLHPSVLYRVEATRNGSAPYRPKNLQTNLLTSAD